MKTKIDNEFIEFESGTDKEDEILKKIYEKLSKRNIGFEYREGKLNIVLIDLIDEVLVLGE